MGNFDRRGPRRSFDRGGFRRDFGPREMHKATCAECGKECEVPFKPTEGRDVFCQECFMKKKGITPRREKVEETEEEPSEVEEKEEESEEEFKEEVE